MLFHPSPCLWRRKEFQSKKKPFVAQGCLLVPHRDLLPPVWYFYSQLTSSQLMKSELRRDTQMLHPGFIMCWKRPRFHWAVFEGGLACVLSWDGSVFVLLNSLTPPGPVSSSLTTAAPRVRERREAVERRWAEPDPPVGSLLYCFKRCCLFTLKKDLARDHAFCSSGSHSSEISIFKSWGISCTQSCPSNLFSSEKAQSTGTKPHFLACRSLLSVRFELFSSGH